MNGKWLKKIEIGTLEFVEVSKIDRLWLLINFPVQWILHHNLQLSLSNLNIWSYEANDFCCMYHDHMLTIYVMTDLRSEFSIWSTGESALELIMVHLTKKQFIFIFWIILKFCYYIVINLCWTWHGSIHDECLT